MEMEKWTHEWPTEIGWYWFYGDPHGKYPKTRHVKLQPVSVHQGANSPVYVVGAAFMYQSSASAGLWTKMIVPDIPKEE